jgi:hypothetical protein
MAMTSSLAHISGRFQIRAPARREAGGQAQEGVRLRLLQSGDGWSLVGPDGGLVFQALGTDGRRRCLEFARAEGVLTVFG